MTRRINKKTENRHRGYEGEGETDTEVMRVKVKQIYHPSTLGAASDQQGKLRTHQHQKHRR